VYSQPSCSTIEIRIGSYSSNTFDIMTNSFEPLVQSLVEEDIDVLWHYLLQDIESDWKKSVRNKRRPIAICGINPSEEEVVISVGKVGGWPEELLSSSLVELGSYLWAKGEVNNVLISIFALLNPFRELCSLDSLIWPIPFTLTLNNVKFTIKSQDHGWVTLMSTRSAHDHGVEVIKSDDIEVVTRLNVAIIILVLLNL
jgi:hypothetical protein